MSVVADVIGGAALILSGYTAKRKISRDKRRDAKAETKAEVDGEVAKAKELSGLESDIKVLKSDMVWIKEQLGKSPNGGGAGADGGSGLVIVRYLKTAV